MNRFGIAIAWAEVLVVALAIALVYVATRADLNWDLGDLEALKKSDLKKYKNLKQVAFFNGPVCVLITFVVMVAAPLTVREFSLESIFPAIMMLLVSTIFFWFAVRCVVWAVTSRTDSNFEDRP